MLSLFDYFYIVFPEQIVFQILTYRPHHCAVLIKEDYNFFRKSVFAMEYEYANSIELLRDMQRKERDIKKKISEKNMLKEIIENTNKKMIITKYERFYLSKQCDYINCYRRKLKCFFHYERIKDCDFLIKEYKKQISLKTEEYETIYDKLIFDEMLYDNLINEV